ncbi:MAG TPA: hypothetical protein EYP10_15195 [Armatimonadetes bacterium]|nr:hypothetical protein [Armatimonadota bacterium]
MHDWQVQHRAIACNAITNAPKHSPILDTEHQHALLPTVQLGEYRITRLIIGGNPFSGFSHVSQELNQQMREYYTDERILEALFEAQRCGLNTMLMRGDAHIMRIVRKFRDADGKLHWIAQTAPEIADWRANIHDIARHEPIAIYHHGGRTDELFESGRMDELKAIVDFIRAQGVLVGIATHNPEVVEYIEGCDWDIDFYVTSFYNPRRPPGEVYLPEDRERMCAVIQNVSKPCIAFKVLAASRHCDTKENLRAAFRYALEHIKPTDAIVVGVWQKKGNQIAEDAQIVRELCAEITASKVAGES